jgi:phosphatidate cytidylyltransferase
MMPGAAAADVAETPPAPGRVAGELRTRILAALVLVPVFLVAIAMGGRVLLAAAALLAGLGAWELLGLAGRKAIPVRRVPGVALALALPVVLYRGGAFAIVALVVAGLAGIALTQLAAGPREALGAVSVTLFAALYTGFLFGHFVLVREMAPLAGAAYWTGAILLLVPIVLTWINDTAAYVIGHAFGRRRLAPSISPGKSLEGAVGALAVTVAAAVPLVLLADRWVPVFRPVDGIALGLLLGIAAPAGDLVESSFKRDAGVKDASRLIPGHGGVLDRFDSLLFTVPAFYYYVRGVIL